MSGTDYGPAWPLQSLIVRSSGRCARCQRAFPPEQLHAHNKIPRRYGGSDHPSNLVALCASCHPQVEREAQIRAGEALRRLMPPPKKRVVRRAASGGYGQPDALLPGLLRRRGSRP